MSIKTAIITSLVVISIPFVLLAQTHDSQPLEDSKNRLRKREYTDISDKHRWEVKARYPELRLAQGKPTEAFNRTVKSLAMKHVNDFKKSMSEYTEEDRRTLPKGMSFYLEVDYRVEFINDELISINFGRSEFTGGAHPNHWAFTLNYDLKNSRLLNLGELFAPNSGYLKVISENSIKQIAEKQGKYADTEWIKRGAGEDIKNFQSWNITADGLKFSFDPYQVGPYVAGSFESIVAYEKFLSPMRSNKFYPVSMASYIGGNPPNWCRNGHFPQYDVEFKLAKIKGKRGESKARAYFYRDDDDCPGGANCRDKKYVIPGDEVIVARSYQDYSCVWFQPEEEMKPSGG